jgi:hypothetical protein
VNLLDHFVVLDFERINSDLGLSHGQNNLILNNKLDLLENLCSFSEFNN